MTMQIIQNVKEIADLVKAIGNVELYRKIIELEGEIIELTRNNRELEKQRDDLKSTLSQQQNMSFRKPFYFSEGDPEPFCPLCWEANRLAIHLISADGNGYTCYKCKEDYLREWGSGFSGG